MIEVIDKKDYRQITNEIHLEFAAVSDNESFARMAVAAFITPLNPTLEEVSDVKTAISEAVTNAIIHGYENKGHVTDRIYMNCELIKCAGSGDHRPGRGNSGHQQSHGTPVYHQTGAGKVGDGICLYGGFYGQSGCAVGAGAGHCGAYV